jgi:hypothetical protein
MEETCLLQQQKRIINFLLQEKENAKFASANILKEIALLKSRITEITQTVRLENKKSNKKKFQSNVQDHMSKHRVSHSRTNNLMRSFVKPPEKGTRSKGCHHCGKKGHIKSYCYKLFGIPKIPQQFRKTHTTLKKNKRKPYSMSNSSHTSLRVSSKDN